MVTLMVPGSTNGDVKDCNVVIREEAVLRFVVLGNSVYGLVLYRICAIRKGA